MQTTMSNAQDQTNRDIQQLLIAADFAAHRHRAQRRKDVATNPYINHPLAVARVLAEQGGVLQVVHYEQPKAL